MSISYTEISIVGILGLVQGIVFGGVLVFLGYKKKRPTLFLGLFVILYALDLLPDIMEELKIANRFPQLLLPPFEFFWLLFPLFYIYVQGISILTPKKRALYLLIPGGLVFVFDFIIFFQSSEFKHQIADGIWNQLIDLTGSVFALVIGVKTYLFINRHGQALKNQYSETQKRELRWAKQFVLVGIIFTSIAKQDFVQENYFGKLLNSIVDVVLLYWVSLHGVLQKNIEPLIPHIHEVQMKGEERPLMKDYNKSREFFEKVERSILDNKTYLKPAITIVDVSNDISEHPKRVSQIINQETGKNFKAYINGFRINEAKQILKSPDTQNLSIEGVGMEVGFKSKSSFYEAFKKETGLTPSSFKSEN